LGGKTLKLGKKTPFIGLKFGFKLLFWSFRSFGYFGAAGEDF